MNASLNLDEFLGELQLKLPKSNMAQRKVLAKKIVAYEIDVLSLTSLLEVDTITAMRFSWLLTEIGMLAPEVLNRDLVFLFTLRSKTLFSDFEKSFSMYWKICGVPIENESKAIELLFSWLMNNTVNITVKSRSVDVLLGITKKYPGLKNELKLMLEDQIVKQSGAYLVKLNRSLKDLN